MALQSQGVDTPPEPWGGIDAFGSPAEPRLPGVRRIAVLRANALGDFFQALPAIESLHAAYPDAELVLLGRRWHQELLRERPGPVHRVVVLPSIPRLIEGEGAAAGRVDEVVEELRDQRFDLAVQMHGGGATSNAFLRRLGARLTVGLRTPDAEPLDRWLPYVLYQPEVLRYLEVASLAGAPPITLQARLTVVGRDLESARRVAPATTRRRVVIHPGSTDPRRRWPVEKFAEVAARLQEERCEVALIGTGDERRLTQRLGELLPRPAVDCVDRLDLAGTTGLLATSALLLGNDSGPIHLARAVGTPTVDVVWVPNLVNFGPVTHRRNRTVISWTVDCPVCGTRHVDDRCAHDVSFVSEVPPGEVLEACRSLLEDPEETTDAAL